MEALETVEFLDPVCELQTEYQPEDYEGDDPRWCKGCGDHAILQAVQRMLHASQIAPESVVCVSGIGCSSRFPYYLKTYGFHGIHGRALPISLGVALAREDLHVITVMGDGDCFSIGAGHWLHAMRYNPNLLVLVFDNEVYALTKKQASPTTKTGMNTNTTPHGAFLQPLNPLSVMLGMPNLSFLAQTATWIPAHLTATIERAWNHRGMAFVRILQRCPIFSPTAFGADGNPSVDLAFLEHEEGIRIEKVLRKRGEIIAHNPRDLDNARRLAEQTAVERMGLLYYNPAVPVYDDLRRSQVTRLTAEQKLETMEAELNKYTI